MNNKSQENSKQKNIEFIPNFTQYPNEILDNWMPHLTGTQTKIVNCFVRQIYGYHKQEGKLSIRLIHEITGIARSKVFDNIKKLIKIGCIQITRKGNKSNPHTYKIINITDKLPERGQVDNDDDSPQKGIGNTPKGDTPIPQKGIQVYPKGGQLNKEINIKERGEIKQLDVNNHEDTETTDEPTIPPTIPPEVQKDIDDNNRLLAEYKAREQQLTEPPPPPQVVARVEDLLATSNQFIQSIGFGFTKNPRHVLDAIYRQLPPDYQVKEDTKDIELIANAIKQYDQAPPSDRDALAKRLYQTVENMAKLYLIKKHGEEFRDKLPVDIHNRNLVIYIGANPTFKYCHSGWSNEIDAIYGEISRVIRKRQEKERAEYEKDRAKVIERERAKSVVLNQLHYTEEQLHEMGYRTVPDILEAMRQRSQGDNLDHLNAIYEPIVQNITDEERKRHGVLLGKKMAGTITLEEDGEYFILDRKLKGK